MLLVEKIYSGFKRKDGKDISGKKDVVAKVDNTYNFKDLTPQIDDKKKIQVYLDALEWACNNENIKTIALTGVYGSGKSTILNTFKKDTLKKSEYLNISLANFNEESGGGKTLEARILQQIFYKVPGSEIPQSRFKRITTTDNSKNWGYSIILAVWLIGLFFSFSILFLENSNFINRNINGIWNLLPIAISSVGLIVFFWYLKSILLTSKLESIKVQGNEINLGKGDSIMNQHLEEILYFFEKTDYNTVIIEDLDRFTKTDIFTKLREINFLINEYSGIQQTVRFIFAIRDDLFKSNDFSTHKRTKFFDFIIPVLPIVTSGNAEGAFIEEFERINIDEADSDEFREFLYAVSIYINDKRLIANIVNEFIFYNNRLNESSDTLELREVKMLAMVTYKNLAPDDFAKLQVDGSLINKIVNLKKEWIKDRKGEIQREIEGIDKQLKEIEREEAKSKSELISIYAGGVLKKVSEIQPKGEKIKINNKYYNLKDIFQPDKFDRLINTKEEFQIIYIDRGYERVVPSKTTFPSIEKEINPDQNYTVRLKVIEGKYSEMSSLRKRKSRYKTELADIDGFRISELLNYLEADKILERIKPGSAHQKTDKEINRSKNDELLIFLMRNGYIDELYEDYYSYFYEGSLKRNDKSFLHDVRNNERNEYNYELTAPQLVSSILQTPEFQNIEVWNFTLIDYIFSRQTNEFLQKQNRFIASLRSNPKEAHEFIFKFVEREVSNTTDFIKVLAKEWNESWFYLNAYLKSDDERIAYVKLFLLYTDKNDLIKINEYSEGSFVSSINNFDPLNEFTNEQIGGAVLREKLNVLNVKFKFLLFDFTPFQDNDQISWLFESPISAEFSFLEFVYDSNLYEISYEMVLLMTLIRLNRDIVLEKFRKANYELIATEDKTKRLYEYITENIDHYTSEVLLETKVEDSETSILEIINNKELNEDIKNAVIDQRPTPFSSIDQVDELYREQVVQAVKMKASWFNVYIYYQFKESQVDKPLSDFLNNRDVHKELSEGTINTILPDPTESEYYEFRDSLLFETKLSSDAFVNLLKAFGRGFFDNLPAFEEIDSEKIKVLIEEHKIEFTSENFQNLYFTVGDHYVLLAEQFPHKITGINEIDHFTEGQLCELLESENISVSVKIDLIKSIDTEQIESFTKLAESIYGVWALKKFEISWPLLNKIAISLVSSGRLSEVLLTSIDELADDELRKVFSNTVGSYKKIGQPATRPRIKQIGKRMELIKRLKERGFISSYKLIEGKNKIQVNNHRR